MLFKKHSILAAFLICLLFAPFVVLQGWMQVRKASIRKEMKHRIMAGIPSDQLIQLSFSKEEAQKLRWKDDKEFEFEGEMYDVVSSVSNDDSITYRCLVDNEETKLDKQLTELTASAFGMDNARRERQEHFTNFVQTLFFSKPATWSLARLNDILSIERSVNGFSSWNISPPSPPPEV